MHISSSPYSIIQSEVALVCIGEGGKVERGAASPNASLGKRPALLLLLVGEDEQAHNPDEYVFQYGVVVENDGHHAQVS